MDYPETPRRPEANVIGGIAFDDDYQWLEDDASEEVLLWQKQQDALARELAQAGRVADFQQAAADAYVDMMATHAPKRVADAWWHRDVPAGQSYPVITVGTSPQTPGRVVVDLNDGTWASPYLFVWEPSPDGRLLAYGLQDSGAGDTVVRIVDVASGDVVCDQLPVPTTTPQLVWLPDSSGVLYGALKVELSPEGEVSAECRVYRYDLAAKTSEPEPIPGPLHPFTWPALSEDGRYLLTYSDHLAPRPHWIRDLSTGSGWQPFLADLPGRFRGPVVGHELVAVTDDGAGNGRVVRIPLANPTDTAGWTELVAETDVVVAGITAVGDRYVLAEFHHGSARLRVLDAAGVALAELPLPGLGAVGRSAMGFITSVSEDLVHAGRDEITFVYSSPVQAPTTYRYDLATGQLEVLSTTGVALEGAELTTYEVERPDGSSLVYRVVGPPGATGPAIVFGYGGFNAPQLPSYSSKAAAWIALGGIWVHAHLRGGGEFGGDFREQGRMHRKQGTFDDLYLCAQDLVDRGITTPAQLGAYGTSNGGLLTSVAAVQRPDLFRAVVPEVPVTDMLRAKYTASIAILHADYGNPDDPDDAAVLRAYSPYHNVQDGTAYPAVFLDCGANDQVCAPWNGRKLAARLQAASTSGHPVVLRVREGSGHNALSPSDWALRDAEQLSFFAQELDLR